MGGVGGALLLALIAFLLLRKRRRDDFDGDFDPDRVVGGRPGGMDLVGGEGAQVEPYNYVPPGASSARPPMSEAGTGSVLGAGAAGLGAGMLAAGAAQKRAPPPSGSNGTSAPPSAPSAYSGGSQSHYAPSTSDPGYDYAAYAAYSDPHSGSVSGHGYDTSPRSSAFPGGFNPAYAPGRGGPSPGPSLPGTGSSSAGMTLPSSKEMEARGLRVANEPPGEGSTTPVVQHQDAGRLPTTPENEEAPNEIPPSYDSIRD